MMDVLAFVGDENLVIALLSEARFHQGDRMRLLKNRVTRLGRIWVNVFCGQFLKITEVADIFGPLFSTVKLMHYS
jgi:hypothetical protein